MLAVGSPSSPTLSRRHRGPSALASPISFTSSASQCKWRRLTIASAPRPQDDEAALEQVDSAVLPLRKRMALIVRVGEKRILRAARAKLDAEFPPGAAPAQKKEKKRAREGDTAGGKASSSGKKSKVRQ